MLNGELTRLERSTILEGDRIYFFRTLVNSSEPPLRVLRLDELEDLASSDHFHGPLRSLRTSVDLPPPSLPDPEN